MLNAISGFLLVISSLLPANTAVLALRENVTQQAVRNTTDTTPRVQSITSSYAALPTTMQSSDAAIDAKAAKFYDIGSARTLLAKNTDTRLPIASITKIMTALVILQNHELNETVTIPALPPQLDGSQAMGIKPGEQFVLSEALVGMLTLSANDMAQALAIWDSGSEEEFVRKMNRMAAEWGLANTKYSDATGLSSEGAYSTADDLVVLATIALRSGFVRQATSQPRYTVRTTTGKPYVVTTTNQLLGKNGVIGLKTGYTLAAGQCLVSLTRQGGREIIGVILGSSDRFGQTRLTLNRIERIYEWK